MAYSHHRVTLFGKKVSQERLASRISALLDITMTTAYRISGASTKCKRRVGSLETAMMGLTKFKRSVAVLQSELSLHAIIFT